MSFSVDLWNGFDIINSTISLHKKIVKQIFYIITTYSSLQKEYYQGLDNLYNEIKPSNEENENQSLIEQSLNILINSIKEESEKHKNHYDNIINNINELKIEYDKFESQINIYSKDNTKKDIFVGNLNYVLVKQEDYNKSCNDLCSYLLEDEINNIVDAKVDDNKNGDQNMINDIIIISKQIIDDKMFKDITNEQIKNLLYKVLENKSEYIESIEECDKKREKYNKFTEDYLNLLQKQFTFLIFTIQSAIHNYTNNKVRYYNEIIEINKSNLNNQYSKIDCKKEINNFIIKNTTKMFPVNKIEFIPYKLNINEMNQKLAKYNQISKNEKNAIIEKIKQFIKNKQINIDENEFVSIISNCRKLSINNSKSNSQRDPILTKKESVIRSNSIFINDFVFRLCNSKEFEMQKDKINNDINEESCMYNSLLFRFMDLIDKDNKDNIDYLKTFIKMVNYYRSKGFLILNENSYNIFVNIFSFILVNYKNNSNFIKNIIILGQTFYKLDNKTKKKIYVMQGLKNHDTFNKVETWHRVINYNLSLSIKNNNNYLDLNKEEYLKNLNIVVLNSIISYLYDIKLITNDKNVYEEVKKFYITIYGLDEKYIDDEVQKIYNDSIKDDNENKINENKEINNINNIKEENDKNDKNINEQDKQKHKNIKNQLKQFFKLKRK